MRLQLNRAICFIDLETTGINVSTDRIVEIAVLKAMPDGSEQILTKRINPEIPIPMVTSLIHGDGTSGQTNNTFLDSSTNNFTITRNGNTTQGTYTAYSSNWSNLFCSCWIHLQFYNRR